MRPTSQAIFSVLVATTVGFGAENRVPLPRPTDPAREPVYRALKALYELDPASPEIQSDPLKPLTRLGEVSRTYLQQHIADYTCVLVKREQVDGILRDFQYMAAKIRHPRRFPDGTVQPLGVYLKFLGPDEIRGREVLYVQHRYNDRMFYRKGGPRLSFATGQVSPTSDTAMRGNRYPLTEIGILRMVERLLEVAKKLPPNCNVQYFANARIGDRACTRIQVTCPSRDEDTQFYRANLYVDHELLVPIRYAAYDWPSDRGGEPVLLEDYTYLDLKLNVGLTGRDFHPSTYSFPERGAPDLSRQPSSAPAQKKTPAGYGPGFSANAAVKP